MARKQAVGQLQLFPDGVSVKQVAASTTRARSVMRADSAAAKRIFRREILPLIENVSLVELSAATGLSYRYCAAIKRGRVPSMRHWSKLRQVGEAKLV